MLRRCGQGRSEVSASKGWSADCSSGRWDGRVWETPRDLRRNIGSDIFISLFPWSFMAAVAPWTTITPTLNRLCEGTWLPDDPSCSRDNLKGTHGFAQAVRAHLFINAISPYFCFIDLDGVSSRRNGKIARMEMKLARKRSDGIGLVLRSFKWIFNTSIPDLGMGTFYFEKRDSSKLILEINHFFRFIYCHLIWTIFLTLGSIDFIIFQVGF